MPLLINPFSTQPVEAAKGLLFEGLTLIMLAGLVVTRLIRRDFGRRQTSELVTKGKILSGFLADRPYFIPALAYLAICGVATLFSLDPGQSFWGSETRQGMLLICSLVIFFLIMAEIVRSVAQAERLITGILASSVAVAIYGCIQYFGLDPITWKTLSISPVHSTVGYSLYLGAYLAMVVPFTLARLSGGTAGDRHTKTLPYLIILLLQVICLLFTLSRGALLALVVGSGVFLGLLATHRQRWIFAAGITMLSVIGGILFLSLNYGWGITPLSKESQVSRSDIIENRLISNEDRLTIWKKTVPMIAGRFLIGYGPVSYTTVYNQYYPNEENLSEINFTHWDPHNLALSQMMTAGILGLLAFGFLFFIFYQKTYSLLQSTPPQPVRLMAAALLASATAYLVQGQFNPSGIVATVIFWLVLAIGLGLSRG